MWALLLGIVVGLLLGLLLGTLLVRNKIIEEEEAWRKNSSDG
ncbi:MAG: hypothetical protein V3U58_08200 [Thermodesulfobacteriota bacterium]